MVLTVLVRKQTFLSKVQNIGACSYFPEKVNFCQDNV